MIQQPIPFYLNQYAAFQDTLPIDDNTEALTLTRPDGTVISVTHAQLTRVANLDGTVTYSWQQRLDQSGAWTGEFTSNGAAANVAPLAAYVI